jgi:hypothetical protein
VPARLQARIRAALWGERLAAAIAAATEGAGRERADESRAGTADAASGRSEHERARRVAAGRGEPAPGNLSARGARAGAGTDPDLLGTPAALSHARGERFDLALDADLHGPAGGARPPAGEAPPAAADEEPALATAKRPALPVHRVTAPAEWEPVVRAVFGRAR